MKILVPVLLLVFIAGSQKIAAQNWVGINKKEYRIKSPAGWTIDSSKQMGTDLVLFSMPENTTDKFRENINVQVQNSTGTNIDLSKYIIICTRQIKAMAPDAKIEESTTIKNNKGSYQKIIYTATQGGLKLKFEQYYFVTAKKVYVITLTAENMKFDAYKLTGEEILNSFTLK